jgi:hypothetical protein
MKISVALDLLLVDSITCDIYTEMFLVCHNVCIWNFKSWIWYKTCES